ncbi:MAG UNVERIFIED_CONTAM: MarC family protein [Planctomycetaceae bacterium]|jgi:multiple antibiotic resistance protein
MFDGNDWGLFQTILLLFIVLDPFGNLVLINSLLKDHSPAKRRWIMLRESGIALGILQIAVFAGDTVMRALGLETSSLGIAGGIVLFMIAMGMIFPTKKLLDEDDLADPVIVPIAIPLLAGPGTISLILLLAQKHHRVLVGVAVLLACGLSSLILALSPRIHAFLGTRGRGPSSD